MEANDLAIIRNEIFSQVSEILFERYGESVPASLMDDEMGADAAARLIKRYESFRADEDLLDLLDALETVFAGKYGCCLLCHAEIDFEKLRKNPLTKFCDACEKSLSPVYSQNAAELHSIQ